MLEDAGALARSCVSCLPCGCCRSREQRLRTDTIAVSGGSTTVVHSAVATPDGGNSGSGGGGSGGGHPSSLLQTPVLSQTARHAPEVGSGSGSGGGGVGCVTLPTLRLAVSWTAEAWPNMCSELAAVRQFFDSDMSSAYGRGRWLLVMLYVMSLVPAVACCVLIEKLHSLKVVREVSTGLVRTGVMFLVYRATSAGLATLGCCCPRRAAVL